MKFFLLGKKSDYTIIAFSISKIHDNTNYRIFLWKTYLSWSDTVYTKLELTQLNLPTTTSWDQDTIGFNLGTEFPFWIKPINKREGSGVLSS